MPARRQAIPPDLSSKFFGGASWIWDTNSAFTYSRKSYKSTRPVASVTILITADKTFALSVNQQKVGQGTNWQQAQIFSIPRQPETILFTVNCTGSDVNTLGLLVAIRIEFEDGTAPEIIVSDTSWEFSTNPTLESSWRSAIPRGQYGSPPWNRDVKLPLVDPNATVPTQPNPTTKTVPRSSAQEVPHSSFSSVVSTTSTNSSSTSKSPVNQSSESRDTGTITIPVTMLPSSSKNSPSSQLSEPTNTSPAVPPVGSDVGRIIGPIVGVFGLFAIVVIIVFFIRSCRNKSRLFAPEITDSTKASSISPFTSTTTNIPTQSRSRGFQLGSFGSEKRQDDLCLATRTTCETASPSAVGRHDDGRDVRDVGSKQTNSDMLWMHGTDDLGLDLEPLPSYSLPTTWCS